MDKLKRLMNVFSVFFVFHALFIVACLISYQVFDFKLVRGSYLKNENLFSSAEQVIYSLVIIPIVLISINYVIFKKLTLWHKVNKS